MGHEETFPARVAFSMDMLKAKPIGGESYTPIPPGDENDW